MVNALVVLLWISLGMVTRDGCAARIAVADVRAAMANVARSVRRIASSSLVYGSSVLLPAGAPARSRRLGASSDSLLDFLQPTLSPLRPLPWRPRCCCLPALA